MSNFNQRTSRIFPFTFAALLALTLFTGCGKKDDASQPASKANGGDVGNRLKSAEKTTFAEVTSHLDAGGNVYGYLNTTAWFEGLSGKIGGWRDAVQALPDLSEKDRKEIHQAFGVVGELVKMTGVESISGVGFSGIALEPGYYQTKFFVHRGAASANGLIWSVTGKTARPLTELDWLPAETAMAVFSDLDFTAVWTLVKRELEKAGVPEVSKGIQMMEAEVKKSTGTDLSQLLSSLGGEYGVVVTLDANKKVAVPLSETKLEVPEPGLLIAIKVKDDLLFDLIDKNSKEQPGVISSEKDGLKMRTMPLPLPLPITLRPTVARYGDFLFIASSDTLVQNIADTKTGKKPGLKSTPEFQRLAKGMPTKGNQIFFLSESMGKTVRNLQDAYIHSPLAQGKDRKAMTALMQKIFQSSPVSSTYSVGGHVEDGWLNVMHGNQNPVVAMAGPLVIAPMGMLAAIAIPNFIKARESAQSNVCISNMRQIALGVRLWATDHNGVFPPNLVAMKNELSAPKVLICPDDKKAPDRDGLTWENFKATSSSYEYLLPGVDANDATYKTMLRCKIHGHTALGDGSVSKTDKKSEE